MDSNPKRRVALLVGISAEQSEALATRPYPLNLELCGRKFAFLDNGTAFVDALEKRKFSFGSLLIHCGEDRMCLSSASLQRLLKLEYLFDKLRIYSPNRECALLPLLAKVDALSCTVAAEHIQPNDFKNLDIVTKDLTFTMFMKEDDEWDALLISFLNRVAQLGHFEKLRLSIRLQWPRAELLEYDDVARVAVALTRAIHANPKLLCLDLSCNSSLLHYGPHLQSIFKSMEEHEGLRTFAVQSYILGDLWDEDESSEDVDGQFRSRFDFDRSWLEQLLSRNRNITVVDGVGKKCTDGSTIDKAYALNDLYNGSASLVKESTELRPLLVSTALASSASNSVQYTALLLSQHVDTLCELIHGMNLDALLVASIPRRSRPKRKNSIQFPRASKKGAQGET